MHVAGGIKDQSALRVRIQQALDRVAAYDDPAVWTDRFSADEIFSQVDRVESRRREDVPQPLYGLTFGVKDNIDVRGHATTAGCPAFGYLPAVSAPVVQKLCDAGAICLGKTTLDQFATGLVGTRAPNGTPRNVFSPAHIPGGSSSGSAVAAAAGLVDFALGTDTAGSGRVPAAFNNIVGYKPTRGMISTEGVVAACRSLDCISVFAPSADLALEIARIAAASDPDDPDACLPQQRPAAPPVNPLSFRFGVPSQMHLRFFGNDAAAAMYERAISRLVELGGTRVEIDFAPFAAAGRLLYEGPWVAERLESAGDLLSQNPEALLPVIQQIMAKGLRYTGTDVFKAMRELSGLAGLAGKQMSKIDLLALPTTGTIYTLAEIAADPIGPNTNLGYYTHFANLLDLCAISVPGGFGDNGLPTGLMLVAPAGGDETIAAVGGRFHRSLGLCVGATTIPIPPLRNAPARAPTPAEPQVKLAVVGAHLSGQPLNHQLMEREARLVATCRTAPRYRFYALAGTVPAKPGLVRTATGESGAGIEVEIWEMSQHAFGSFVAAVPAPMVIGTLELEDGAWVKGFLCEPYALSAARDISEYAGWRNYLSANSSH
jgi:allophanate hydrolase